GEPAHTPRRIVGRTRPSRATIAQPGRYAGTARASPTIAITGPRSGRSRAVDHAVIAHTPPASAANAAIATNGANGDDSNRPTTALVFGSARRPSSTARARTRPIVPPIASAPIAEAIATITTSPGSLRFVMYGTVIRNATYSATAMHG